MKRTGFARQQYEPAPRAPLQALVRQVNAGPSEREPVAVSKGVVAKPGKGRPTVDERRWMQAALDFGCYACWVDGVSRVPGDYHHIVEANRRLGHAYGFCLCSPGHHRPSSPTRKISIHPGRSPIFIHRYGPERGILARLRKLLGFEALP